MTTTVCPFCGKSYDDPREPSLASIDTVDKACSECYPQAAQVYHNYRAFLMQMDAWAYTKGMGPAIAEHGRIAARWEAELRKRGFEPVGIHSDEGKRIIKILYS